VDKRNGTKPGKGRQERTGPKKGENPTVTGNRKQRGGKEGLRVGGTSETTERMKICAWQQKYGNSMRSGGKEAGNGGGVRKPCNSKRETDDRLATA